MFIGGNNGLDRKEGTKARKETFRAGAVYFENVVRKKNFDRQEILADNRFGPTPSEKSLQKW